ncbi:MAG: type 1 glutamine amidotransferase [Nocardioides sp.]
MRALVIQHDHISPLGPIADRLEAHGYQVVRHQLLTREQIAETGAGGQFGPAEFAPATDFDLIVPMGSIFSVYDRDRIGPWLVPELDLIRQADTAGVPVFGICFGGQLLAEALGGSVERSPHPEIGWTRVESADPEFVSPGPWFQWHYDRWTVPPGARELAWNANASQAFVLRRNLALQFHPELTAAALAGWLRFGGVAEATALGLDPDALMRQTVTEGAAAEIRAHVLVDAFLTRCAPG